MHLNAFCPNPCILNPSFLASKDTKHPKIGQLYVLKKNSVLLKTKRQTRQNYGKVSCFHKIQSCLRISRIIQI